MVWADIFQHKFTNFSQHPYLLELIFWSWRISQIWMIVEDTTQRGAYKELTTLVRPCFIFSHHGHLVGSIHLERCTWHIMTSPTPDICAGIRRQSGWYPSLLGVAAEPELTYVSDEAWWAPLQPVLNSTSSPSTVSSIQTQNSPFLTLPRSSTIITVSAFWWRSGWRKTWNPDPEVQHLLLFR